MILTRIKMKRASMILLLKTNARIITVILAGYILGINPASGQDTTWVRGVVRTMGNKPAANVAVSIEGSSLIPVVTGEDGSFRIPTVDGKEWLIIDPAGTIRSVLLNKREEMVLFLTPSDLLSGGDPILVFSTQIPRRNMVPSFSELNTTEIDHTSALSVDQHMQGRVAGMYVIDRSGMPGSGAVTTIRTRSLSKPTSRSTCRWYSLVSYGSSDPTCRV
jgi:hypothetical protein